MADLTAFGARLRNPFETVKAERAETEDRWLRNLRQFRGLYDPEEESRLDPKRSRHFTRMTRIKVKSVTARLLDLVFPAGSEDNWTLDPTPVPDIQLDPMALAELTAALGMPPEPDQIRRLAMEQAEVACANMEREIRDQLAEVRYRRIMSQVIHSGNLYGTGILKGPLVNRKQRKAWVLVGDQWVLTQKPVLLPFIEFTPVWNMYPDSAAVDFTEARFNYERTVLPRHFVLGLAAREDFDGAAIKKYLYEHKEGNAQLLSWEQELRRLGLNLTGCHPKAHRYEVLEYWGVLSWADLEVLGILPEGEASEVDEFWGNVWLLGNTVIKAELQPIEGVALPYYAYYYDKDETSIFGEGLPDVMRDDQKALNASHRAMLDNAAITAGPQIEVNTDLIDPSDDVRDVHPFKVWLRSGIGMEAQHPAVRTFELKSNTAEFQSMGGLFMNNIHESTIPSYMHGEATSKGSVGRTVGGLSLLMSQAQIALKGQLMSLDDDVMRPFIEAMYHWNMQFSPKPEIKGDFSVRVKGTSSLVAREIRAQNLEQFATSTMNQFDAPYIDRLELNRQRARVQELGDGIVLDPRLQLNQQIIQPAVDHAVNNAESPRGSVPGIPGYGGDAGTYQTAGPEDFGTQEPVSDFAV